MHTTVSTRMAAGPTGGAAGRQAATDALASLDADRVDFCQVFSLANYDHRAIVDGVRATVGEETLIDENSDGGTASEIQTFRADS